MPTDAPLTISVPPERSHFIPETDSDRDRLEGFGSDGLYEPRSARVSTRAFARQFVDQDDALNLLVQLATRRTGLRLYAGAIRAALPVPQIRELWRVVESAFGRKGLTLVDLLVSYPPAIALGFDRQELESLQTLRGRASHAESKRGDAEIIEVERLSFTQLPRLKNLCERVI